MLNPWDYILMLEGALALSGSPSRRLGAGRDGASFPFTVDSSPVGYASAGKDNTRGELWLPLWDRPARYSEVRFLLSEGRAEVGRDRAWSGLTFAQAVAGLGVDRGIKEFVRYEFQERLGQSYLATPLGRFGVPDAPLDGIELVRSLNAELAAFRLACRAKSEGAKTDPPARFPTALRGIDAAIYEFCKYGGPERLAATRPSDDGGGVVRPEPAMLSRLRAGDVAGACEVAGRRLRAAGFVPLPGSHSDGSRRNVYREFTGPPDRPLAALLFPVTDDAVNTLGQMVLRRPTADAIA